MILHGQSVAVCNVGQKDGTPTAANPLESRWLVIENSIFFRKWKLISERRKLNGSCVLCSVKWPNTRSFCLFVCRSVFHFCGLGSFFFPRSHSARTPRSFIWSSIVAHRALAAVHRRPCRHSSPHQNWLPFYLPSASTWRRVSSTNHLLRQTINRLVHFTQSVTLDLSYRLKYFI